MSIQPLRRGAVIAMVTLVFSALSLAAFAATTEEVISVKVDQAKLVKMPEMIATIVIGNPLIADVTLQPGGVVVVTGKGYGATNVIALDRRGIVLSDRIIQVEGPSDRILTVYRGLERESYSCNPLCERRVTLGDSEKFFKSAMEQGGTLNSTAAASTIK